MSRRKIQGRGHDATGRSPSKDDHHFRLYGWQAKCPAWRALSPAERCVYIEIELRFFGTNNGAIAFSSRTAADACNISKATAQKAFHRLVELGFIECRTPASFGTNACKAPEWRLTRAPCNVTGDKASKAFMTWRPQASPAAKHRAILGPVLGQSTPSPVLKCA